MPINANHIVTELLEAAEYLMDVRRIDCQHACPEPDPVCAACRMRDAIARAEIMQAAKDTLDEPEIKYMVQRFLGWRLPDNFNPDCGIHFDADAAKKLHPRTGRYEPIGTNLFDAHQAEAMVRYITDGMP